MKLRLKEMSIESYKSMIEYNPDAIFILSLDGVIEEINQVTLKMFGFMKEEIQGKNYQELIVPEYIDFTNQQFGKVLNGHSPEYETQLFHKNGDKVYLQVKNIPLWDNGEIVGVFGVGKDSTELHKTKATLTEMEERIKSLFYSTGDSIDILDLDGNVLDVNPAFEELYGWKRKEIIGRPLPIIPEYRYNHQEELLAQAKCRKHMKTMETICIKKDGTPIEVGLTFSPILDKNGNVLGTAGITRDITERKQLEKSLKESEERYRKVVELSPKGIVIHQNGTILYANPSALKIVKEENAIGKSIYSYIHPNYHEQSKQRLLQIKEGQEFPFVEFQMVRTDGEVIYAEIIAVSINYNGNPATLSMFRDVTERKIAEKALEESEKRYRKLVELSPEPIVVHQSGRIQYANPACIRLLGASSFSELMGKPILDFSPPEYIEVVDKRVQELNQTGMTVTPTEEKVIKLDGEMIDVEVTGISIDYNGKPSVLMMLHNLTKRKQAEEALCQSEEKYRLIAENMTDLVGVLDGNGRVIYASPSHEYVLGIPPEMYEGNLARNVVHPDDELKLQEFFDQIITTNGNVSVEIRLQNNKKEWLWFELKGRPVYDEDGNFLHYLAAARNTTERKHSEEAIRKSEENYRLIAENMNDFVCIISPDRVFKYASPSHEAVLGFPVNVYEGNRAREWMHPDDIKPVGKLLQEIVSTKETGEFEFRFRDSKGNWIWFESKATPVFTEDGQFTHFLVVSREITERRMYEEKLTFLAFHDTLTGLPNRRLFTNRLDQAIKEAERYERKIAVMYMDMDRFKQINDTLGHDVGDELLKQFAERVRGCLRGCDTLARQGGDEFTVLLPEIQNQQDAVKIAQRILDSLQGVWEIGEHSFNTTSSIGIAFYPADGITRRDLMKLADKALYKAKEDGRNNFKTYSLYSLVKEKIGI